MTTLSQVMNHFPPHVETVNPAAPRPLGDLIERCLVKDRNARLGSMEEIAERLGEIVKPATRVGRRWLLAGGSAAALRQAQLTMRKQKQWAAPYYWAAFVQQGEWR